jgi:hypothetical protein
MKVIKNTRRLFPLIFILDKQQHFLSIERLFIVVATHVELTFPYIYIYYLKYGLLCNDNIIQSA